MRLVTIAIAGLLAAACSEQPENVYDVPVDVAFERLTARDLLDFRAARQCGILIHFRERSVRNESVHWTVTSSGRKVAEFTARLTALEDGKTRVDVEIPAAEDGGEIYDGTKFYPRPALYQPLRPAVAELVDARIEQREFDVHRIPKSKENRVCQIQRGGLESGFKFSVEDMDEDKDTGGDWSNGGSWGS